MGNYTNSSPLVLQPSFLKGVARVVDLFGQLDEYNYSSSNDEADSKALKRDWFITGEDISSSMKQYGQKGI